MVKHKRRPRTRSAPTLPDFTLAALKRRSTLPGERTAARLDALLVLAAPNEASLWSRLPEAHRWRGLHSRAKPVALKSHAMTLGNARQTQALLGFVKPKASTFERLSFAGKLVRELAVRRPARIGLIVSDSLADAALWCEALLTAVWTESFALPNFRSRPADRWRLQSIELY